MFGILAALLISVPARAETSKVLRTGAVYACVVSDSTSLIFDGKAFAAGKSTENVQLQIRILKNELEMTLTSRGTGEIYTERDRIVSRSKVSPSLFAIYEAPMGNVVSLALHALKNGDVIFTQSKTYVELSGSSVYQSTSSGKCREL